MALGFIVGDTVNVGGDHTAIQGIVTRIELEEDVPVSIEIKRPGGSHNEFLPDSETGFDYITKVV